MKILYDSVIFDSQKYGGASKCFCEVFKHYPSWADYELPLKVTNNTHILESGIISDNWFCRLKEIVKYVIRNPWKPRPSIKKINREYNIRAILKGDYDVFHHTFTDDYFIPYIGNKPFIYTIHDMIPELFPEMFNMNEYWVKQRKFLCEKASKIVAVSESTKKDLVEIWGINSDKVVVVHHGGPLKRDKVDAPLVNVPYFLFVGARDKYKNFSVLLHAFAEFKKMHKDFRIICTGRPFNEAEISLIEKHDLSSNVFQKYVSDKELLNLYQHAVAFIYPSLYEGFGLPILEAFSCGCPTILSNCSCFPEIGGDAAIYFDAKNNPIKELLNKLEYVASLDNKSRDNIIQMGYERLKCFTWEASAQKLCKVYESMLCRSYE